MSANESSAPISSEEYKKVTEELYKQNLEVVKLYKQVEELNERLEEANEGQANLLHILNHQIKSYLTKARIVLDDLLNDSSYNVTPKGKEIIKEGFDSVTEGVNFVKNFLDAANVDRGTFQYDMALIDFKTVVAETVETQRPAAEGMGLKFSAELSEGDYNLMGDKVQLGQVVKNLIDNSIRYTPSGSVAVRLERKGDKVLFSVKDTGVGISDELKPKLFTKGGRAKDSQKINVNSTGFGLAFVRGVVEAHNGRVWAESSGVGKGSTFFMELPVTS